MTVADTVFFVAQILTDRGVSAEDAVARTLAFLDLGSTPAPPIVARLRERTAALADARAEAILAAGLTYVEEI